jgi:hypothetical protein
MVFNGLTDSLASTPHEPDECPHCSSVVRLHHGLCLGCLVQTGLNEGEGTEGENLDTLFSAIE